MKGNPDTPTEAEGGISVASDTRRAVFELDERPYATSSLPYAVADRLQLPGTCDTAMALGARIVSFCANQIKTRTANVQTS